VRYARESILECFEANRTRYPVLLPAVMDEPPESLAHLRLHNGTIWRWNRPLIGFDEQGHRIAGSSTGWSRPGRRRATRWPTPRCFSACSNT
jgi:hypothetical protein